MNKILFEVSYIGSPQMLFIVAAWILIIILEIDSIKKRENRIGNMILLVVFSSALIMFVINYITIVSECKQGHYYEVEGIVENYIKEIKKEKFTINDVEFYYGEDDLSLGYSLSSQKHAITGNGQYLRIRYIRIRGYNEIVYIEEIAED